jgi:hypothetical protein
VNGIGFSSLALFRLAIAHDRLDVQHAERLAIFLERNRQREMRDEPTPASSAR